MSQIEQFPIGAFGIADPERLGALGAVVIAALITLLYVFQRRPVVLLWMVGWFLLASALALGSRSLGDTPLDTLGLGLSRFLSLCGMLAIALSPLDLLGRQWSDRRYLLAGIPVLLWCLAGPFIVPTYLAVMPGYLAAAMLLAGGGLAYLAVLRQTRLLGAGIIGGALLLAALTQSWIGVEVARSQVPWAPAELAVINGVLFLFATLGLHLLVFEEMTSELKGANRKLRETQRELRELALTDPLTGCHNRRFFHEVIGRELRRRQRYALPLSILFVDIDHFKEVNDTLGHEVGDRLLEYVALFLRRNVRDADYVFRWGGDEFLLLLSCDLEEAQEKGAHLTRSFRAALDTSDLPTSVGLSVGCSDVKTDADDIMTRIREADEAMYRNKQETEAASPRRTRDRHS